MWLHFSQLVRSNGQARANTKAHAPPGQGSTFSWCLVRNEKGNGNNCAILGLGLSAPDFVWRLGFWISGLGLGVGE